MNDRSKNAYHTSSSAGGVLAFLLIWGSIPAVGQVVSSDRIRIEVDGAVTAQGQRVVRRDSHLYDVLSLAEPTANANLEAIQIVHGLGNQPHATSTVNYLSYVQSKQTDGNPALQDGDVITVFEKQVAITITLRGAIVKPGAMSISNTDTVLDAIQAAGGLLPEANRKTIIIQHAGASAGISFDYDAAGQSPGGTSVNPVLRDGDTIVVDALATVPMITISGGVLRPAPYPLSLHETLAEAIDLAGGLTDGARPDRTTIVRRDNITGRATLILIDAHSLKVTTTTYLQGGDNIIIPYAPGHRPSIFGSPPPILIFSGTTTRL